MKAITVAILMLLLVGCAPRRQGTSPLPAEVPYLFVLSAQSGSFSMGRLTLNDVRYVIYFSNRPKRLAGHLPVARLLAQWDKGPDSFASDPPNALLSIFNETSSENPVIELSRPQASDRSVSFDVRLLDGHIPASFGPASLFIDEFINSGAWTGT